MLYEKIDAFANTLRDAGIEATQTAGFNPHVVTAYLVIAARLKNILAEEGTA